MSDRFQLKKNSQAAALSFFVNLSLVFFSYRVLISVGGVQIVGIWAIIIAFISVMRFGDVGMANASIRYVARYDYDEEPELVKKVIETGFLSNMIIYGLLSLISYLILKQFLHVAFPDEDHLTLALEVLPYLILSLFISNSANCILGILTGLHKGYIAYYLRMAGNLLQIAFIFILVPTYGLVGMAVAQALQFGILAVIAWYFVQKTAPVTSIIPRKIDIPIFKEMFAFGVSAQVASVAGGLFEPFSKILLGLFVGPEFVGYYELAYKTAWLPRNAIVSVVNASLPAMTNQFSSDADAFHRLYKKVTQKALLYGAAVLGAVVLFAPVPSYLWFGEVNMTYWSSVAVLAVAFAVTVWTAPGVMLAHITGKFLPNTVTSASSACLMLGIGYGLGKTFNMHELSFVVLFALTVLGSNLVMKILNERAVPTLR